MARYVVACLQTVPVLRDVAASVAHQRELLEEAIAAGARLLVLPECSTGGYAFESRDEAVLTSAAVGRGAGFSLWLELASRHDVHIVAGFVERDGDALYNAATLVGPSGVVGLYRKVHLWNRERELYDPGNLGFPVYDTPCGRIGMHICYDAWFPEAFRIPATRGADIICAPSNWVANPEQRPDLPSMARMMDITGAHSNLLYVATASRGGFERGARFVGESVIVDHSGWPLALAAGEGEETIYAEVDPIGSRERRRRAAFNQPLRDRRTDVYDEFLGADPQPHSKERVPT